VVFFDRRIWHARSRNYSRHTRKAVFFGCTYRWTVSRDVIAPIRMSDWFGRLTPEAGEGITHGDTTRKPPAIRLAEGAEAS
jgi:hypothetical protein